MLGYYCKSVKRLQNSSFFHCSHSVMRDFEGRRAIIIQIHGHWVGFGGTDAALFAGAPSPVNDSVRSWAFKGAGFTAQKLSLINNSKPFLKRGFPCGNWNCLALD